MIMTRWYRLTLSWWHMWGRSIERRREG
jgi:hypothetical protein